MLITVKASPQPSAASGDTVCVAGVELDGDHPVGLIRLYPVPFRYLDGDQRFVKYQVVDVRVERNAKDPRPESHRVDITSFHLGVVLGDWSRRTPYVEPLVTTSMCRVLTAVRDDPNAASLAVIRPAEIIGLRIKPHEGWTPAQQRTLDGWVNQTDLFDDVPRTAIEAPPFKVWYRYRCGDARCGTHEQGILDWELTALQRRFSANGEERLRAVIEERFLTMMCAPGRDPAFFVGNQAEPTKRRTFSVLGTYYPPTADAARLALF